MLDSARRIALGKADDPCNSHDQLKGRVVDLARISTEVDRNYDFFQRNIARFIEAHRGQFALIRNRKVIDFFDDPGEAASLGSTRFPDQIFSIQEVTDASIDLGLYAYASN